MTLKRRMCVFAIVAGFSLALASAAHGEAMRKTVMLDSHWRFAREDVKGGENPALDDSGWEKISLPHSFNAKDGDNGGGYYRGPAWYRRNLTLAKPFAGHRAFLQFDGATLIADVWVNGKLAGRHEGGFAAFRFDVTDLLHPGRNSIAVRIDNAKTNTVSPLGGDFTLFGGITRSVHLIFTSLLHVDALDDGGAGVAVTASAITAQSATLEVDARVTNDSGKPADARILTRVLDGKGREVARGLSGISILAGTTRPVTQRIALTRPHLWDAARDPYLYTIKVDVTDVAAIRDSIAVPFGVRSFRIDPKRGFFLNGRHLSLHGVDLFHAERPGKGTAVSDGDIDQDFRILKELGANAVRMVHFQHPQRSYDDADRAGYIVWTEIPLNSAVDPSPAFENNIRKQIRELIRQNINHPSVFFWGLGNEIYTENADSKRILAAVQSEAKKLDSTRLTVYAHCCQKDNAAHALISDAIGYNRYLGWYDGTLDQIGPWADKLHASQPQRAFAISEYGAGAGIRQQEDPPQRPKPASNWHPEQYQALFHEAYLRQLESRPFVWGSFVWTMFDLASDGRHEGERDGINDKGLVTYDRAVKKDAFYWYKANWSDEPFVYITSRRFSPRKADKTDIKVYSNAERVTLFANGKKLSAQAPDGRIAIWHDVELKPGYNIIVAVSKSGAHTLRDRVVWRAKP